VSTITFADATRRYPGSTVPAVDGLDLDIADGEFMVLVGPSGCGKTTSLRMLAGLEGVDAGTIHIGDRDVTRVAPSERDISMVFQNYVLYPHLTVAENIGFHLMIRKTPKAEIRRLVQEAAELLDLVPYLDRRPAKLSGGQRQRVAMGRAIVRQPQVFLMDEPLSNLDAKLRGQTRVQIASLQRRLGVTTVYVTHDQVEAMTMGDRVAVMKDGVLQQCDTPRVLFDRPVNVFVAGFIGSPQMNLLPARVAGDSATNRDLTVSLTARQRADLSGPAVTLGLRPSALVVSDRAPLRAEVQVVEELGADAFVYCTAQLEEGPTELVVRCDGRAFPAKGEVIGLEAAQHDVHVFDQVTGRRVDA
jgi:multiple sugar transport system ATP-binding protein